MFIQNKYAKWYFNIIDKAKTLKRAGYIEKHHIEPKSLGGSNDITNIVDLSAREHFICHMLLVKMTAGSSKIKMARALHLMMYMKSSNQSRYRCNSHLFQLLREQHNKTIRGSKLSLQACANIKASRTQEVRQKISNAQKGRAFPGDREKLSKSVKASMTPEHRAYLSEKAKQRKPISEETRIKMKNSKKPMSQETIDKLSIMNKERILSDESRAKLSAANKGKKRSLTPEQRQKISDAARVKREARLQESESSFKVARIV